MEFGNTNKLKYAVAGGVLGGAGGAVLTLGAVLGVQGLEGLLNTELIDSSNIQTYIAAGGSGVGILGAGIGYIHGLKQAHNSRIREERLNSYHYND